MSISLNVFGNISNTILLSGIARGGSTFVGNLLNHRNTLHEVFEPLNFNKIVTDSCLHYPVYYSENTSDKYLRTQLKAVLLGKNQNNWTRHLQNEPPRIYRKILVKSIRSNLLLPYITHQFPSLNVLLLLRNPFSQVTSFELTSFPEKQIDYLGAIIKNEVLVEDFNLDVDLLGKVELGSREDFFHRWCIDTKVALSVCEKQSVHLITYEELLTKPETLRGIIRKMGLRINDQLFREALSVKSETTKLSKNNYSSDNDYLDKWKKNWSLEDINKCNDILKMYDLDHIYSDSHFSTHDQILSHYR